MVHGSIDTNYPSSQMHRQKIEWWVPGPSGRNNGELLFNGYKVSNWDGEKSVEMDGGDVCTIFWMYLMPLIYTL